MSVWPNTVSEGPLLSGRGGPLVSVSIHVPPRDLESLLDALAHADFPINPQIYHDAAIVYLYDDGREESEAVALVEFPAYVAQLGGLKRTIASYGLDPAGVCVADMLSALHTENRLESAPPGAPYQVRLLRKHAAKGAACL